MKGINIMNLSFQIIKCLESFKLFEERYKTSKKDFNLTYNSTII